MKAAEFSECGRYRYVLRRTWLFGEGSVLWILLNPSTADAVKDDPTIRRCVRFSEAWGYQEMTVVNLFALRAADPVDLMSVDDPVGPDNDRAINAELARGHDLIVCAWGARGDYQGREHGVMRMLDDFETHHLGLTSNRQPKHPLYLWHGTKPQKFVVSMCGEER